MCCRFAPALPSPPPSPHLLLFEFVHLIVPEFFTECDPVEQANEAPCPHQNQQDGNGFRCRLGMRSLRVGIVRKET